MSEQKIHGYVAWHPTFGTIFGSCSPQRELVEYDWCTEADQRDGWRIRPILIVFADEPTRCVCDCCTCDVCSKLTEQKAEK